MSTSRPQRVWTAALAVGLSIGALPGCGSKDSNASPATTAATTVQIDAVTAPAGASQGTLDANTASEDEMKASFEAAGLPNAEKWADEIAEYRPFDSMDAVHEKLKEYEISDDTWAELSALITVG